MENEIKSCRNIWRDEAIAHGIGIPSFAFAFHCIRFHFHHLLLFLLEWTVIIMKQMEKIRKENVTWKRSFPAQPHPLWIPITLVLREWIVLCAVLLFAMSTSSSHWHSIASTVSLFPCIPIHPYGRYRSILPLDSPLAARLSLVLRTLLYQRLFDLLWIYRVSNQIRSPAPPETTVKWHASARL